MIVDLVFEGGGVLGISFVGAYQALNEQGIEIKRASGTSAGSVIATLIMAGYSSQELVKILEQTDFTCFMKKTKWGTLPLIGTPLSLYFNDGIYNSLAIEQWVEELLQRKGITQFKDVMDNGVSRLKIIAADITRRKMLILPDDLVQYGINPKTFSIAKAVRMSCAIPYFFTPVIIQGEKRANFIVDGGLLSSFPIWIFDLHETPIRPTIGLKIKDDCSQTSMGKSHLFGFTKDLIDAVINQDEMYLVKDKDMVRTIVIKNDPSIKATNFELCKKDIETLYKNGFESTKNFFTSFKIADYIKEYLI